MARMECASRDTIEFAAQGGQPDALFELGLMYCTGCDVGLDLIEAHKWFNLAAMRGNDAAKAYRGELARDMSKDEIATAQRRAREWMKKAH